MAFFKKINCILGLLLLLLTALVSESRILLEPSRGFVQTRGTQFVLNGSPFLFNGFNSYWMMNVAAEPTERYKISNAFGEAAVAGLGVCRAWAFSDGGSQAMQISPGVYDERVFQALDFVISEARRFGVRLILSLSNNYKDFGGRAQYANWGRAAGVPISSDDDFYTHPVLKGYDKNHVQKVVTRMNTITKIAYKDANYHGMGTHERASLPI